MFFNPLWQSKILRLIFINYGISTFAKHVHNLFITISGSISIWFIGLVGL